MLSTKYIPQALEYNLRAVCGRHGYYTKQVVGAV